jgi:hypothetical protein
MEIMLNEYYACVSEFAEERDCAAGNAFLNTVMMQYYEANGYYSDIRRRYYKPPLSPKFTVGSIYRGFTANTLIDDRGTAQEIAGDNLNKFIHIDFNIDINTRHFIERLKSHSVKVTLEPNNLVILDKEKFEATHDVSSFKVAFKCNAIFWNGAFFTIGYLDDENSICEALQELWKKIRIKSRQCFTINQALRLRSVDTGRIPYYGSFYNDWGRYINRDWD